MRYIGLFVIIFSHQYLIGQDTTTFYQYASIQGSRWGRFEEIDFGTDESLCYKPALDAEGKKLKFSTSLDALNYLSKEGWEFVEAFPETSDGSTWSIHWIIRKSCALQNK